MENPRQKPWTNHPAAKSSKRFIRRSIVGGLAPVKKMIKKHPKLKQAVRNLVLQQINIEGLGMEYPGYRQWLEHHYPDAINLVEPLAQMKDFSYRPLISILTPTYNTNLEHLREAVHSVQAQIYPHWEFCIVDDASTDDQSVQEEIKRLAATDERIKYQFRHTNGHISQATNDAVAMSSGEFIGILDHDDVLWPNALFEVAKALNADKKLDFLYSDEDKIDRSRFEHLYPFFKPDWNPEFLESVNYITHFTVLRKSLVEVVGGFRSQYDGAQDWDLFLRCAYQTKHIHHIPTVLYSWRMSRDSTATSSAAKPYATEVQKLAIEDSLKRRGQPTARVVPGLVQDQWSVTYPVIGNPKVSIVIPTKNQLALVKACLESIYKRTAYQNFEVILVDTGTTESSVRRWYETMTHQHPNLRVLNWPEQPFNYSRACNFGAESAAGSFLVMLNNDTEVMTADWLQLMLGDAQRDDIGAVGCKLYYADGFRIQHAGIGVGLGGLAANLLSPIHNNQLTQMQHFYANSRRQVSAVTAACMMVKKDRFDGVGGFDEEFRITFNDVDLCLRLGKAGFRTIYNPAVELLHHESVSLGLPTDKKRRNTGEYSAATALFKKRWQAVIDYDPQLNPNLDRSSSLLHVRTD